MFKALVVFFGGGSLSLGVKGVWVFVGCSVLF